MISNKLVTVLGAGASKGFGLPLGSELRTMIARDLNIYFDDWGSQVESGSLEIVDALRLIVGKDEAGRRDINAHRHAAVQISGAMALSGSIDEYIERHKEDVHKVQCAKLAIAKSILEAEKASLLYIPVGSRSDIFETTSQSWLASFLRGVTRGLSKSHLSSAFENIAFINFNYDRCLEHYAFHWFQRVYDLSEEESADVCRRLQIFHPYGSLGPLPWQTVSGGTKFGAELTPALLVEMARGIQTYSEATDEVREPGFVRTFLGHAKLFMFLGFGFHQQNLSLLSSANPARPRIRVYATTEGLSIPRVELLEQQLATSFGVSEVGLSFNDCVGPCERFWEKFGDVII